MKKETLKIIIVAILAWAIGHWMGYWYGRSKESYEWCKQVGKIPPTATYSDYLKQFKPPHKHQ